MIPSVIAHDEEGWRWLWLFHMPAAVWRGRKACFSLSNRTKQLQPIDLQLASALGTHTPVILTNEGAMSTHIKTKTNQLCLACFFMPLSWNWWMYRWRVWCYFQFVWEICDCIPNVWTVWGCYRSSKQYQAKCVCDSFSTLHYNSSWKGIENDRAS